jgi:RHS repeat-associated protein
VSWDEETGLYNAKARYFDPKLGRFLSQDSFLGQIEDPPSLHRYFYGHANPIRYVDLTGHSALPVGEAAVAQAAA